MNPKAARKKALKDKKAGKHQPQGLFVNILRSPHLPAKRDFKR